VIAYDKEGGPAGTLRNIYLLHAARLVRYSTGEAEKLIEILDAANRDIKALIIRVKSIETKKQYARVAAEIRTITKQLNEQFYGQVHLDFEELAVEETAFVKKSLRSIGLTVELGLAHISPQRIWAAAGFGSYAENGHETFETYLNSLSDNLYKTWDTAVRAGYLTGMTAREINRRVLGSVKDMEPGQMQALRNSLSANTHTMIASMAEQARDAVYRENERLFDGYRYLATLDTRTCLVCAAGDGRIFKNLDEAPKLPRHLRCRCLYVPCIKGFEDIPGERAAMGGPVSDKLDYKDWLAQQTEAVQREILGPARYAAYKNGVPVTAFVAGEHKLTLAELRQKEGLSIIR
jgi:SPP1 gp7 family putative phage head morphogenesis protein